MIKKEHLVNGQNYKCLVNDIVTCWVEDLSWVGGKWSHETQNDEYGKYPCIVDYAIHKTAPNKKQVREVLTIDNCISYLFKNKDELSIGQAWNILKIIMKKLDL